MTEHFIEMKDVYKSFEGKEIVQGVDFQIGQGDVIGLLGPNGSGKTTTVRLLNGVIRPERGLIRVAGLDPQADGDGVRSISGVVAEGAGLYHDMTATQNLDFFSSLYGCSDRRRICGLLEVFELTAMPRGRSAHSAPA